jgi:hypothetical protein
MKKIEIGFLVLKFQDLTPLWAVFLVDNFDKLFGLFR